MQALVGNGAGRHLSPYREVPSGAYHSGKFLPKRSSNHVERSRRHIQVEKTREIVGGSLVREIKRTLRNTKVMLDKPQDAPEVVAKVVKVSLGSVSRDYHQRYAEAM
jgi:hypothetical protein